ncbi:hypothetical protein LEP3755_62770 (plasmid) [Leptolyngbya sp. NIES-3755]|nr:hypothetical protein LEP3755_62770 [Leptolyngbya sp. NIES-3755]
MHEEITVLTSTSLYFWSLPETPAQSCRVPALCLVSRSAGREMKRVAWLEIGRPLIQEFVRASVEENTAVLQHSADCGG